MKNVVVIGGGIGGLASAALLAKDGYKVVLFEKNKILGGRARYLKMRGFTFDMGPSWYMMPEVFENFFSLFSLNVKDFYNLKRLDNHYRVFFEEGDVVDVSSDLKKNLETFRKFEADGDKKLKEILDDAKFVYDFSMNGLVFQDYRNLTSLIKPSIIKNFFKLNLFQSLDSYLKSKIKDHRLRKLLEFTTVFLGGSPFNTPAFYRLVTHADFNLGIYYPLGGMYKVVEALESLCNYYGVKIVKGSEVKRVGIENGRISSVFTKGKSYKTDAVVVNADMAFFETKVLPKEYRSYDNGYWRKKTPSPSAFLIYLGLKDNLPLSKHHNLYFASDWDKHFDTVYNSRKLPKNPSFYWHVPSKTDPSLSPKGAHSVMILVPMPPGLFLNKIQEKKFCDMIISKFAELNKINKIESKILAKKIYSSRDFASDYNSYQGSAFGLSHTLLQTALFRPRNYSKKLKNLFYVGHHTNPGIGVPPVLISSQIVYRLVKNELF